MPGTAGDERDARFAGDARPRVRHVHCGGFVPRVHEVEPGIERRVEHGHDVVARERENVPHARVDERADEGVGAAHRVRAAERRRQQLVRAMPRGRVERPGVDDELVESSRRCASAVRLAATCSAVPTKALRRSSSMRARSCVGIRMRQPPAPARPADCAGPARSPRASIRASSAVAALRLRCRPRAPRRRSSRSAADSARSGR